jgi:membrane protease YdiL (CAAX protease family)
MSELNKKNLFPTWWDILMGGWLFVLAMAGCSTILKYIGQTFNIDSDALGAISYVGAFLVAIILFYIYRRFRSGKQPALRTISRHKVTPQLLLGTFLLLTSIGIASEPLMSLLPKEYFTRIDQSLNSSYGAIITIIVAPIFEEYFFRGMIQQSLVQRYGSLVGVLLAAALFGIIHFNPVQIGGAFLGGIAIGYVYNRTQSLSAAIFIHSLNNALSFLIATLLGGSAVTLKEILGGNHQTIYHITYAISVTVCVSSFWIIISKLRKK